MRGTLCLRSACCAVLGATGTTQIVHLSHSFSAGGLWNPVLRVLRVLRVMRVFFALSTFCTCCV